MGLFSSEPNQPILVKNTLPGIELKPGDIFCSSNPMSIGVLINAVQRLWATDRQSKYSHAGIIVSSGGMTLEADWHVDGFCMFQKFHGDNVIIGRWIGMTNDKLMEGLKGINSHIGNFYPVHRLILHLIRVANLFHWHRLVCSELVAKFLYKMGARHPAYFGTNPDHIADEIHDDLNADRTGPKFEIVFEGILPWVFYYRCRKCNGLFMADFYNPGNCPQCDNEHVTCQAELLPKFCNKHNLETEEKIKERLQDEGKLPADEDLHSNER
jgi:hypothetical protein